MLKTRKEALDEFLSFVGEPGDDDARDVAERALNRAVDTIWKKHPWRDFQSPAPLELTVVPNQRSYALPDFFGRVGRGVVRNLTKGTELYPLDTTDAQHVFPSAGTSLEVAGDPGYYEIGGTVGVLRQPLVTGQAVEVVSDSALDFEGSGGGGGGAGGAPVYASTEGADANGNERRVRVSLNGLTPVLVGTFSYIDSVGKSYPNGVEPPTELTSSAGTVTWRIVGGASLQTLFPEESGREHRVLTLYPKPSAADVIAIPVLRRPKRLLFDADTLPNDWWEAIFEEMVIAWRQNTGELALDANIPRPHLLDLVSFDNMDGPQRRVKPWRGSR